LLAQTRRASTSHRQYLLFADAQPSTDNAHDPLKPRRNVLEIATDYLDVFDDDAAAFAELKAHCRRGPAQRSILLKNCSC
jgi:hypothetical protein